MQVISRWSDTDLQCFCREHGLRTSGTPAVLRERVTRNFRRGARLAVRFPDNKDKDMTEYPTGVITHLLNE